MLCVFKYLGFFVSEVDGALNSVGLGSPLPLVQIVLPIGISFFTFQAISYVVDVYRGETRAASLGDVAILQAFFPHLVAGPIVRANELLPQLRTPRDPREVLAGPGLFLIAGGLVKKTVVADELARNIVDPVFNDPRRTSGLEVLFAIYGFAAQIYCDFSGYTDMAIGTALLLGFQLPQNFNGPYLALSLQDFWRRWHMTLSRWLRDYLYIPLGGNRDGERRTYRNLMLTMLLGGLWHGAAWTFVIWGGIHGGALSAGTLGRAGAGASFRLPIWLAWLITFHVVCLAWVFFRSPDLSTAFAMLGGALLRRPVAARHTPGGVPDRRRDRPAGGAGPLLGAGRGLARDATRRRPGRRARPPDRGRGRGRRPGRASLPSSTSSSEPWTVHPAKTSPCPPAACSA